MESRIQWSSSLRSLADEGMVAVLPVLGAEKDPLLADIDPESGLVADFLRRVAGPGLDSPNTAPSAFNSCP